MPDELDDLKAALADKYAIERELGRGGMATVYLAVDLKHKRKVAVKVLRPDLAAILGAERFLREIEVTANLQHPNILPLYDSGQAGKSLYYVMPFVEGESLRDRLDREKQLPVEETVEIAKAIAAALQYAHERNVVHRDIKPENILLQSGQALVADFGIALAVSQAGDGRMTETGVALGTPHYMSPEQATGGRDLDARSDIYSLGAMTYEMLTGDPPHSGSTVQAIVAKIVTEMPSPITQTRSMVPENVDAAVQVALAKSPADRFTSAERFAQALADPGFVLPTTGAHRNPLVRSPLARFGWPATSLALLVTLLAVLLQSPDPPRAPVVRAALSLGPGQELRSYSGPGIARDGSFFVYPGSADAGNLLWVRRLDETEARAIPGSEGGRSPRVSPDGQRVSFQVWDGNDWILKVASLADGAVRTLTDTLGADVADWGPDDHLYFQGPGGLWRISANGGQPELAAPADSAFGERGFGRPHVLPNGRGILMTSGNLKVFDLETKTIKRFEVRGGYWQYTDGYIVYRNAVQGEQRLFAIPFDAERLEITGEARQLPFTPRMGGFGSANFAVSPSGALVYVSTERGRTDMVWVSRDGTEHAVDPDWDGAMRRARISPDGMMSSIYVTRTNRRGTRTVRR